MTSFLETLLVVLVTLKLFGLIILPWWLVLSPLWLPVAVAVAAILIGLAFMPLAFFELVKEEWKELNDER